MTAPPSEVTALLARIAAGDAEGMQRLMPLVYGELRQLAARQLRDERPDHTLSPTSLVHEAYLRLTGNATTAWEGRNHFFGVAAQAMRRILVDHARRRTAQKRSRQQQVTLDETFESAARPRRARRSSASTRHSNAWPSSTPRQARVVELRYFVGLSIEETAEILGTSPATVKRDWMVARAWLQRELSPDA